MLQSCFLIRHDGCRFFALPILVAGGAMMTATGLFGATAMDMQNLYGGLALTGHSSTTMTTQYVTQAVSDVIDATGCNGARRIIRANASTTNSCPSSRVASTRSSQLATSAIPSGRRCFRAHCARFAHYEPGLGGVRWINNAERFRSRLHDLGAATGQSRRRTSRSPCMRASFTCIRRKSRSH